MRLTRFLSAPLAVLLAVQPAAATEDERSHAEALRVMAAYAKCLVNTRGYKLLPLMQAPAGDSDTRWRDNAPSDCLAQFIDEEDGGSAELKFSPLLLRVAVFEAYYHKRFDKGLPFAANDIPPLTAPGYVGGTSSFQRVMSEVDCAIRKDLAGATALLATKVATPAEASAFANFAPHYAACVSEGRRASTEIPLIRGAVAEVLYDLASAKAPQ